MPRIKAASLEEHNERIWRDITVALRTLLVESDYESVTMGRIAEKAGIARNTLYNYARDKPTLVFAIIERAAGPVLENVARIAESPKTATERTRAIVDELMHAFTDGVIRQMIELTPGASIPSDAIEDTGSPFGAVAAAMERVVKEGVRNGEFRVGVDVPLTGWLLSGVVRSGAERMIADDLTPGDVIPAVQDLIIAAISVARNPQ